MSRIKPELKKNAKHLRREMTPQERRLWFDFLKSLDVTVRRQMVFGHYIVDFYIAAAKLVIELDGSQHYEQGGMAYDSERDNYLNNRGLKVIRYANSDIDGNFDGVCEDILQQIGAR